MNDSTRTAVVAGLGPGLSAALCRQLIGAGYRVAGLARSRSAGEALLGELGGERFLPLPCDLTDTNQVEAALTETENRLGPISVYIHNASRLHMGAFLKTEPGTFTDLWQTTVMGAVHGTQRVLPGMLERGSGAILFVGATASIKAGANFSAFGAAKFALHGLAQSLARELGPRGIHVAHLIVDGVIWGERAKDQFGMTPDQCLKPEAIAVTCLHLIEQDRSAWTLELDIRPNVEAF